jgi:hypothetical protein
MGRAHAEAGEEKGATRLAKDRNMYQIRMIQHDALKGTRDQKRTRTRTSALNYMQQLTV